MRTSLIEIAEIERYIFQKTPVEKRILFQVKMILDKNLKKKVFLQKKIYSLLALYHKKELKKQAEEIFAALMENPDKSAFQKEISVIFKQDPND